MRTCLRAIAPLLALCLTACLEQEEEITVRPDGSVSVRMAAKAEPKDLADGYPLPLGGPWVAANDTTLEWIRVLGPDTGSPDVRANLARLGGPDTTLRPDHELRLEVRAEFPGASAIPEDLAPASEPFRSAYLQRSTELRIERKGPRTVYVFERTYRGRSFERLDLLSRFEAATSDELRGKIEKEDALDEEERADVVDAALDAMRSIPEAFAGDALLSIYVQGDASLSAAGAERVLARVRRDVAELVTRERIQRIVDGVLPREGHEKDEGAGKDLERLEEEVRAALRRSFEAGLLAEDLPRATANALRGELEWLLTARDHTDDLGDDEIALSVRMPGTVVGGNFDELEDGAARWRFSGGSLRDRDRVLRVVSVVE